MKRRFLAAVPCRRKYGYDQLLFGLLVCCGLFTSALHCTAAEPERPVQEVEIVKNRALRYYRGIGTRVDYRKARALYLRAAGMGDSDSRYISGGMLFLGMGGKKERSRGISLLLEAAAQGKSTSDSEKAIAHAYLLGQGVPRNYPSAVAWYSRSAERGDPEAMNELGFLYAQGKGVEADLEQARVWFQRAAYKGLPIAQYNIGVMYSSGDIVGKVDLVQACGWISVAAANGFSQAEIARASFQQLLSVDERTEAQRVAEHLLKQIAAAKDSQP